MNYSLLFWFWFSFLQVLTAETENVCGDWETYKEEKCIKLISTVGTKFFAEAEKTCSDNSDSRLISIHNMDEQTFLVNYLFTKHSIVDNIWLGAKYSGKSFKWEDGSNLTSYSNWAAKNPKIDSSIAQTCVQMHAEAEIKGQWSNEPCTRMNRVVCERKQRWTLSKMQELIERMQKTIGQMEANQVPLGFIYVQLPKEKAPQEEWPGKVMTWTDVSAQYDSTFFRVAGTKSKEFGTVQDEFTPFIDQIKHDGCTGMTCPAPREVKLLQSGGWTGNVIAAWSKDGNDYKGYLNFHSVAGEVRPRNMAVKVWKRTS